MPLFQKKQSKLIRVKSVLFKKELELQKLTEQNLDVIYGLKFVRTEFPIKDLSIDTLAFDEETKTFVIIEYKKNESFSVIDQGFAYLSLMLDNKAAFVLEYNERFNKNMRREDIDWSQARVMFISPSFTRHQIEAVNFRDLPLELWEVEQYDNGSILYRQVRAAGKGASITKLGGSKVIEEVSRQVKVFTIEDHLKGKPEKIKELFNELVDGLRKVDLTFELHPVRSYVSFHKNGWNLITISVQQGKISFSLLRVTPKDLKDPEKKMHYMKNSVKYYNQHISSLDIKNMEDVAYALMLTRQLYEKYSDTISKW
ncbi:MAG: DUF5655 domain-containing protein [Patescibacteria group bacterium]